jgi:hypothetical protein
MSILIQLSPNSGPCQAVAVASCIPFALPIVAPAPERHRFSPEQCTLGCPGQEPSRVPGCAWRRCTDEGHVAPGMSCGWWWGCTWRRICGQDRHRACIEEKTKATVQRVGTPTRCWSTRQQSYIGVLRQSSERLGAMTESRRGP